MSIVKKFVLTNKLIIVYCSHAPHPIKLFQMILINYYNLIIIKIYTY